MMFAATITFDPGLVIGAVDDRAYGGINQGPRRQNSGFGIAATLDASVLPLDLAATLLRRPTSQGSSRMSHA